ncbi:hypothetical protein [Paenibacillus sp. UNC451MF]|uniref:hypothetical protein n=1 Tax=Paenibacillus sp. UNC451MF TaxID=1449063 RepID=UPI000561FD51|nr:hypothetical protein [Paenibacillus sp. UNC451MF]
MKHYKGFRVLTSPIHLHTAAANKTPVLVFQEEELIGSGVIEEVTELSVKINKDRYMREVCKFVYVK